MTPPAGTGPRAAGFVARERLERHGVGTLSDAELLTILAGPAGSRAADAVLGECGRCRPCPKERAGDLARIDGVTPRTAAVIKAAVELGRRTPRSPRSAARRTGLPGRPRRLPGRSGRPGFGRVRRTGAAVPGLHSAPTTESSLRAYIRRFFGGQFTASPRGTVSFECRLTTPRTTPPSRPS